MVSVIASFYSGSKICQVEAVEAGLRNFNKHAPFPEEINRTVAAGVIADIHFPSLITAWENLE